MEGGSRGLQAVEVEEVEEVQERLRKVQWGSLSLSTAQTSSAA